VAAVVLAPTTSYVTSLLSALAVKCRRKTIDLRAILALPSIHDEIVELWKEEVVEKRKKKQQEKEKEKEKEKKENEKKKAKTTSPPEQPAEAMAVEKPESTDPTLFEMWQQLAPDTQQRILRRSLSPLQTVIVISTSTIDTLPLAETLQATRARLSGTGIFLFHDASGRYWRAVGPFAFAFARLPCSR